MNKISEFKYFYRNGDFNIKIFQLLYILITALYVYVAFFSFGYDDEFFNINLIEQLGWGAISFIQKNDVHPPGSYFVDLILFNTFGSWRISRCFISLFTAISVIYICDRLRSRYSNLSGIIFLLILGLNPAILMWCTGLRWYSMFVPILIFLTIPPDKSGWWYWIKCFGGLLLLGYISYAFFIIMPSIILIYWNSSDDIFKNKIKYIIFCSLFFILAYLYQFLIFIHVHLKNRVSQVLSIQKNFEGIFISQFSNQGIFPISVPGIISVIGICGIFTIILYSSFNKNNTARCIYLAPYIFGIAISIVLGLAGKFRNLVILNPLLGLLISTFHTSRKLKYFFYLSITFIIFGNLWGISNVVLHQDTTKNSWNYPFNSVIIELDKINNDCNGNLLILTYDPTFTWNLKNYNYQLIGPLYKYGNLSLLDKSFKCVSVLKTYRGSMNSLQYEKLYSSLKLLIYDRIDSIYLGRDHNFSIKQKIDKYFPEYSVVITTYYNPVNINVLTDWIPSSHVIAH